VAQALSEEGAEIDTPCADRLSRYLNAPFEEQFLYIPVTQGIAVVELDGMADD